jgi:hypothetical protein
MLVLILFVLAVVTMFVVTVRTRPDGRAVFVRARHRPRASTARPVPAPADPPPATRAPAAPAPATRAPATPARAAPALSFRPESLEGILAILLIAGEITRGQYRQAVEELAAQDEAGHPLAVPPESGPAGA